VVSYLEYIIHKLQQGPFTTVDAIIEINGGIVVIERSNPPFGFALPGGFVDYGESLEEAVTREAREETGLELLELKQFHTYSAPDRDPRFHTIGTVFLSRAEGKPQAGDDAKALRIVKLSEIEKLDFAFDHKKIIGDYIKYKNGKDPFSS
jgi:ADP-ribose pyrophosphatase YjhB (NUDIX family)